MLSTTNIQQILSKFFRKQNPKNCVPLFITVTSLSATLRQNKELQPVKSYLSRLKKADMNTVTSVFLCSEGFYMYPNFLKEFYP